MAPRDRTGGGRNIRVRFSIPERGILLFPWHFYPIETFSWETQLDLCSLTSVSVIPLNDRSVSGALVLGPHNSSTIILFSWGTLLPW